MSRYSRQVLYAPIGAPGQEKIGAADVLVVGCGALGSALAEMLARAGIGRLTVADRDFVEESNLHRQSLFEEEDARLGLPKAVAAERRLRRVNSAIDVRGIVTDVSVDEVRGLVAGRSLVLDGTDNFETRFLVNEACLEAGVPWVYGACVGGYGLVMPIRPRVTPCLRCVLEEMPPPGSGPTCDTAGVIAPIVQVVAGVQGAEALKLLTGSFEALLPGMLTVDVWEGQYQVMDMGGRAPWCPACTSGRYDSLRSEAAATAALCGRDAVQVRARPGTALDLGALAARLGAVGRVTSNDYLVRAALPEAEIVVFADGRALVRGVHDVARARSLYARYVGA